VIFEAATDSADQLCYLAGNDLRGELADHGVGAIEADLD
jgi:hypothetical protein